MCGMCQSGTLGAASGAVSGTGDTGRICQWADRVLIFTGYAREELEREDCFLELLNRTDVLVDGPYLKEANDKKAALRGSLNQKIHYLNPDAEAKYEQYLKKGRQIQNFVYEYRVLSVGIYK